MAFHEYIFLKGGYMTPSGTDSAITPVFNEPSDVTEEHFDLKLYVESIFTKNHFTDSAWVRWHATSSTGKIANGFYRIAPKAVKFSCWAAVNPWIPRIFIPS
ncbi:hypothetical protein Cha6605_2246 [Chamaesiphon minutus PCC 6605]|uniref:Uncharacterized protein n=1 Tax=Chamaesiphon minutus (strain ATCC 27169 / PCC 6605) TaxID=1173020 RepID=K9UGL0_CHAP6|nr:hypothetical protein Cha6605_2246 [Chamaesiphon minutus PCC 6605]